MMSAGAASRFKARLLRAAKPSSDVNWAFVLLPKRASDQLPRRGRTTVDGAINGQAFRVTLEPDGQLSHWLPVSRSLVEAAGAEAGDMVTLAIRPVKVEPEPAVPADFQEALAAAPLAQQGWRNTTTIARLDWIHWIESAKQSKTRAKRIADACEQLASGHKRVCCFDPSGHYSKAFRAPEALDS